MNKLTFITVFNGVPLFAPVTEPVADSLCVQIQRSIGVKEHDMWSRDRYFAWLLREHGCKPTIDLAWL
jgi:hypothetical protein